MISSEIIHIKGLILSLSQYDDSSAIATFAYEDGIIPILLKGVYKPKSMLKPMLLIFNYVEVSVYKSSNNLYIAKQAEVINDISKLYFDYNFNITLNFLQELAINLFQYGDEFPLEEFIEFLKALRDGKDILSILLLLLGSIYQHLGLKMETDKCLKCQNEQNLISYSIKDGGFYCKNCSPIAKVDEMNLYILKYAFLGFNKKTINKVVPKEQGKRIFYELTNNLIDYFDLKKLNSLSSIYDIL